MDDAFLEDGSYRSGEDREWLELFGDAFYLKGKIVFDDGGEYGGAEGISPLTGLSASYYQDKVGVPFGRFFIINKGVVDIVYACGT